MSASSSSSTVWLGLSSAVVDRVLSFVPLVDKLRHVVHVSRALHPLRPAAFRHDVLVYTAAVQRGVAAQGGPWTSVGSLALSEFIDDNGRGEAEERQEQDGEGGAEEDGQREGDEGDDDDDYDERQSRRPVNRLCPLLRSLIASCSAFSQLRRLWLETSTRSLASPSVLPVLSSSSAGSLARLHTLALMGNASEPTVPSTFSASLASLRHLPALERLIVRSCSDDASLVGLLALPVRCLDLHGSRLIHAPSSTASPPLRLHPSVRTLHLPCTSEDALSLQLPARDGLDEMFYHYAPVLGFVVFYGSLGLAGMHGAMHERLLRRGSRLTSRRPKGDLCSASSGLHGGGGRSLGSVHVEGSRDCAGRGRSLRSPTGRA